MTDATGFELWKSDGTLKGTKIVRDLNKGPDDSYPSWLTRFNGGLMFAAERPGTGEELYRTSGTYASTKLVRDFAPGSASSLPKYLNATDGKLHFAATRNGVTSLCRSRYGTGMQPVPISYNPPPGGIKPWDLTTVGKRMFFSADDAVYGRELWIWRR